MDTKPANTDLLLGEKKKHKQMAIDERELHVCDKLTKYKLLY